MTKEYEEIFKEELEKSRNQKSVFEDGEKASPPHVPEKLVHREKVLERLSETFIFDGGDDSGKWELIYGPIGAGKTAMMMSLSRRVEGEKTDLWTFSGRSTVSPGS